VIVGIAGSLRTGSFNAALLRAAAEVAPPSCPVEIASIRDVPLYDADLEERGVPATVVDLKDRVAAADGLLLVTPEYNHSLPGVFKNVIDWMSRPTRDIKRVFGDCPVGIMGATPGGGGTRLAQTAWLPVLRVLGTKPWFGPSVFVPNAGQAFDETGRLVDDKLRGLLTKYMSGFAVFMEQNRRLKIP
jgi:NAD(P)H-dependent FMN reductase